MDKTEGQSKLKAGLKDVIESLSVHGLPRAVTSKTFYGKLFWFAVWTGIFTGFLLTTTHLFKKYKAYEIYIKVTTKTSQDLEFPAITICNTNRINYSENLYNGEKFPESCNSLETNGDFSMTNKEAFEKGCSMFLPDMLHSCRFNVMICKFPNDFQPCKSESPCFTFNANGSLKQKMVGPRYGLKIILFLNDTDITKLSPFSQLTSVASDGRQGIKVYIHPQDIYPVGHNGAPITAPVGFSTDILIKKVIKKRKEAPYPTNCSKEGNPLYKQLFTGAYTYSHCIFSCFHLKLYETCGEVSQYARVWMPSDKFPKHQNKTTIERAQCVRQLLKTLKTGKYCDCPSPCLEHKYNSHISRNPWPQSWQIREYSIQFAKALNVSLSQITESYVRENFGLLNVFFDEFTYEEISEEALYDTSTLLSDIGGLMGLLLGASIITVIEFIWLVGIVIRRWFQAKEPENVVKVDSSGTNILKEVDSIKPIKMHSST